MYSDKCLICTENNFRETSQRHTYLYRSYLFWWYCTTNWLQNILAQYIFYMERIRTFNQNIHVIKYGHFQVKNIQCDRIIAFHQNSNHSVTLQFPGYIWFDAQMHKCVPSKVISLIPHPVASEHRWLVKAPRWIHSVPDVSGRRSWRCGCQARL